MAMITTIILTVSRDDFLTDVISSLELLKCDRTRTNLLCIVDGDARLYTKVRNLIADTKFNERLTVQYPDKKTVKKFDVIYRRRRITAIHNFAKQQVGMTDYVLLTEDDTIVPPNTLERLTDAINIHAGIAFVEGVEVGRWGTPYVGAWIFNDIYEPTSVTSLPYKDSGMENIDAGGFYCTLIQANLYKSHVFESYESLGPDISMGLRLRQQGYQCYVDWGTPCKHLNIKNGGTREVIIPDSNVQPTTLQRKNENNWQQIY